MQPAMAAALTEVSYGPPPEDLPDASLLGKAAQRLIAIPEEAERREAIATLFKLVDGILAAPEEAKKRRVKKANETFNRKIGRFVAGVDFLRACGFLEGDDPDASDGVGQNGLLLMPVAHLMRLTDAHHTLAQSARGAGLAVPELPATGFNPFSSTVQAADTTSTAKASQSWKGETERLRDEVKKRQRLMKEKVEMAPPIDLQPTAFWLSGDRKLVSDLSRKKVHEFCILRVVCPDRSVLQAHFRSRDRCDHVLAVLAPLLAPHVREAGWYIYQSPPLRRLNPQESLVQAGFAPGANLYLGFEGGNRPEPPYLAADLVSQLGAPPAPGVAP